MATDPEVRFFETRTSGVVYRGIDCSGFVYVSDLNYPTLQFRYDPFLAYFMGQRVEVPKGKSFIEPNVKAYLYADAESLIHSTLKISDERPIENNEIIKIATLYSDDVSITKIENTNTEFSKVFLQSLDERFKRHVHDGIGSELIDIDDQLSEYFDIPNDFLTVKYDAQGLIKKVNIYTDKTKVTLLATRSFFYDGSGILKKTVKNGRKFIYKYSDNILKSVSDEAVS